MTDKTERSINSYTDKEVKEAIRQTKANDLRKFKEFMINRIKEVRHCQSQDKYQEQIDEDDIIILEDKFILLQIGKIFKEEKA